MNIATLTRSLVYTFATGLVALSAATASAEMILLSAQRSIQGIGTQLEPMSKTFDGFESVHTDLLSSGYVRDDNLKIVGNVTPSATQTSTIAPDRIRGLGRGSGFASGPDAEAVGISSMEVMFEITPNAPGRETRYTLAGELRIAPHGIGLNGSSAFVRLEGPTGTLFDIRMDEDHPPQGTGVVFSGADVMLGVLPPGVYTLSAMSEGHGSAGMTRCADFDFTFGTSLAIIPEPASGALLAMLTLVGLPWLRRR